MRLSHGMWMALAFGAAGIAVAASACNDIDELPAIAGGTGGNTGSSGVTMPTGGGSTGPGGGCAGGEECVIGGPNAVYLTVGAPCTGGTTPLTDVFDCSKCACQEGCSIEGNHYQNQSNCSNNANPVAFGPSTTCANPGDRSAPFALKATVTAACAVDPANLLVAACQIDAPTSCSMNGACLPANEPACVLVNPTDTCPSGFTTETEVHQPSGTGGAGGSGGAPADVCGCDCTTSGTCPQEVLVHDTNDCSGTGVTFTADGTCQEGTTGDLRAVAPPDAAGVSCTTITVPTGTPRKLCCRL